MAKLNEQLDRLAGEFDYPEHDPEWVEVGSALLCVVCGRILSGSPERVLPTGVVYRGGPALDAEAEDLYRQEKRS